MGRFIHIPPPFPRSDWANNFGIPWWKNSRYCVGTLSQRVRKIRVINTLTLQEQIIEVIQLIVSIDQNMYHLLTKHLSTDQNMYPLIQTCIIH